jgi:hypothetical protein
MIPWKFSNGIWLFFFFCGGWMSHSGYSLGVEFLYLRKFHFEIEETEEIVFSDRNKFSHNFQSSQEPTISYTQLLCWRVGMSGD